MTTAGSQPSESASSPKTAVSPTPISGAGDQGTIVVTARKKAEDILKTPITINALTSADIKARAIVSLQDVAAYTPGMNIDNAAAGRNDRSFQQIIIRGFTPPSAAAQTTSVFIDGAPVTSATAVNNVTDPERVEILKGPQSAYFGRQTFAGAVNIVTKLPSNHLSGSFDGMVGTRNNRDVTGELSGPLLGDILGFRLTAREYARDGSYKNGGVPGQTLGDQETKTATLALVFKPASNLTLKAFGLYTENRDGPSAEGLISAYTITSPTGQVILNSQSNCVLNGHPYICGVAPSLAQGPSANTIADSYAKNFLSNPTGRLVNPSDGINDYGLHSRYYHLHLAADWTLGDVRLSSLTAYNNERISEFSDIDNYYDTTTPNNAFGVIPNARPYFDFPYLVESLSHDWSQELRASYDHGPFKGTVGVSYLDARSQNTIGGGNGALGTTVFAAANGQNRAKTEGVFFGLTYNITHSLSISFDGRYQQDHLYNYAPPKGVTITNPTFAPTGQYAGNALLVQQKYNNFLPRGIVQYNVTPSTMVYASYSQGVNPASFNNQFLTLSPYVQQVASADGYKIVVDPEKVDNYEVGLKGRLFQNRLRYSLAAYRAIWKNQINSSNITVVDPNTHVTSVITAALNSGRVRMTGVEGELTAYVTPNLTIDVGGAINDSHIEKLLAPTVTALTGITDFSGKENPFASKYSAIVSAEYSYELPALYDTKGYVRGDFVYKSGVYSDAANVVRTPAFKNVNLRVGLNKGPANVELFVTNLFDNHAYSNIADSSILTPNFRYAAVNSDLVVGLRDLRTFGIRVHYAF